MDTAPVSEFDRLMSECARVTASAAGVRDALLSLINFGACNLSEACYAVKCRVKDPERLAFKVLDRRKKNPAYEATSARDIVGLRLLALHSANMPSICRRLVDFIRFGSHTSLGLFAGDTLSETVEEIIVYRSTKSSVVYSEMFSYFSSLGLSANEKGESRVKISDSPDDKPYSSVHIVCFARNPHDKTGRVVPIEIQIRTSLEDTWAEIDHPRKYKARVDDSDNDQLRADAYSRIAKNLDLLKKQIDIDLEHIDIIVDSYTDLGELFPDRKRYVKAFSFAGKTQRLSPAHMFSAATPEKIRKRARAIDQRINDISNRLDAGLKGRVELVPDMEKILQDIEQLDDDYEKDRDYQRADKDYLYWSAMENAFLNAWLHRIAQQNPEAFPNVVPQSHIRKSLSLYFELERDMAFKSNAWLRYRLGTALLIAGYIDDGLDRLRSASRLLENDRRVPPKDIIRSVIHRQLSYALWVKKQGLWERNNQLDHPHLRRSEHELIREAYEHSIQAFNAWALSRAPDLQKATEVTLVINNVVCFAWELVVCFGTTVDLNASKGLLAQVDSFIDAKVRASELSLSHCDSLLKALCLRDKKDMAADLLAQINETLSSPRHLGSDTDYIVHCVSLTKQHLNLGETA